VPEMNSFDYAVLRVVPRVEREEFLNAGVVLFCMQQDFLAARVKNPEQRLAAIWPDLDTDLIRSHLEGVVRICRGDENAGPIARLSKRERFHWLVAPRSTMIQVSPVHSGLCLIAGEKLDQLFKELVEP
jgi:Protein of unknown function (DUF3037)